MRCLGTLASAVVALPLRSFPTHPKFHAIIHLAEPNYTHRHRYLVLTRLSCLYYGVRYCIRATKYEYSSLRTKWKK
jgi:hypothetical protein